ncbi:hypothetical protein Desti_5199 [Desulfomonile tiedjei DSM 6799]|uniref:Uncharacterized protein n=1 Tax=Desulfomonile tiedjei (strain ATCC 49306 / DSM 6799 / DCB-1) TaxID=706587 RepID=I4CE08_DESTA|nr:hypothetical protein Desti_5199 [Desulfomonile tiedjei DSM 6799]
MLVWSASQWATLDSLLKSYDPSNKYPFVRHTTEDEFCVDNLGRLKYSTLCKQKAPIGKLPLDQMDNSVADKVYIRESHELRTKGFGRTSNIESWSSL